MDIEVSGDQNTIIFHHDPEERVHNRTGNIHRCRNIVVHTKFQIILFLDSKRIPCKNNDQPNLLDFCPIKHEQTSAMVHFCPLKSCILQTIMHWQSLITAVFNICGTNSPEKVSPNETSNEHRRGRALGRKMRRWGVEKRAEGEHEEQEEMLWFTRVHNSSKGCYGHNTGAESKVDSAPVKLKVHLAISTHTHILTRYR